MALLPEWNGEVFQVKRFDGELLRDIPQGKWVAISAAQDRIAGIGATIDEALAQAKQGGETEPSIMRVSLDSYLIL